MISGGGATVEIFRSQCRLAATGGDLLQRAHGAEALGVASKLIDGTAKATALFDFPYAGSPGASCSTAELATGDGHRGTGPVPGRRPTFTASFLAFPEQVLIDGFAERFFWQRFGKDPSRSFPIHRTNPHALLNDQRRALAAARLHINSHSGCQVPSLLPYGRIGALTTFLDVFRCSRYTRLFPKFARKHKANRVDTEKPTEKNADQSRLCRPHGRRSHQEIG